jgi:hypothetical protein
MRLFLDSWKSSSQPFFNANVKGMLPIHFQGLNNSASDGSKPHDSDVIKSKVIIPTVTARIKQRNFHASLKVSDACARGFSERAGYACQSEVLRYSESASGLRRDVIDMKGCFLSELGDATVFATIPCAIDDSLTKDVRNRHELRPRDSNVRNATGGEKANRLAPRALRLRDAHRPSIFARSPACRATHGAADRRLSASVTASIRRALRVPIELSVTYTAELASFLKENQGNYERSE